MKLFPKHTIPINLNFSFGQIVFLVLAGIWLSMAIRIIYFAVTR